MDPDYLEPELFSEKSRECCGDVIFAGRYTCDVYGEVYRFCRKCGDLKIWFGDMSDLHTIVDWYEPEGDEIQKGREVMLSLEEIKAESGDYRKLLSEYRAVRDELADLKWKCRNLSGYSFNNLNRLKKAINELENA